MHQTEVVHRGTICRFLNELFRSLKTRLLGSTPLADPRAKYTVKRKTGLTAGYIVEIRVSPAGERQYLVKMPVEVTV